MKVLENEKRQLRSQYQQVSQQNTALQSQVNGLKASEKELAKKLHQEKMQAERVPVERAQASPAPVPKPRTNVHSPQLSSLQGELEEMRKKYQNLLKKCEEEKEARTGVESSLTKKRDEYQELVLKYNQERSANDTLREQQGGETSSEVARLTEELSQLKVTDESTIREKEAIIKRIMTEKADLQTRMTSIERQKQTEISAVQQERRDEVTALRRAKDNLEGTIANLEEKLRLAASPGAKGSMTGGAMARRLNDALGKNKELETVSVTLYNNDRTRAIICSTCTCTPTVLYNTCM